MTAPRLAVFLLFAAAVADGSKLGHQRKSEPFDRYEDGHLEEPLLDDDLVNDGDGKDGLFEKMNSFYTTTTTTTKTTTTTTTTKMHVKSSCVTSESPMDKVWMDSLAPLKVAKGGTECVFGVDARDEGGHCIHQNGKYGAYGWCFTTPDGSEWGSCSRGCPMYGQEKKLNDRIKELEAKLADTRDQLIPQLAKATAKVDCMDCRSHSSLLGSDAKVDCAKPCKGMPSATSVKVAKPVALVQQGEKVAASRKRQRNGQAKVRSSRFLKLEAKLAQTKEWLKFLMTASASK